MTFSIIIPAFNGERYIEEAILSALCQTRQPDEIIVHDDNSNDSTRQICEKYFTKIVYHFNADGPSGFVNGWNKAVSFAKSDFIVLLHQDDLIYPTFLEEAEQALIQNPAVRHLFALCDYIGADDIITNQGETAILNGVITEKIIKYTGQEYVKAYQKNYNGIPHIHRCPGVITHRTLFEAGCNYKKEAGHIADDDFFYRVAQYSIVIGIMKSLAAFRIHKSSETGSIGDLILVTRLANDYLYQIKQWKNSDFMDNESMQYFIDNAFKYKKRLLGYGIKLKDDKIIDDALNISVQLKNEKCFKKDISISILEFLLSSKMTSSLLRKVLSLFY